MNGLIKELTVLAAKSIGQELRFYFAHDVEVWRKANDYGPNSRWEPYSNGADALELLTKLRLSLQVNEASIVISFPQSDTGETQEDIYEYPTKEYSVERGVFYTGHNEAVRLAILRAAAQIGRNM